MAAAKLAELVDGRDIVCEGLDTDPYNRVVARCHVGDVNVG